MKRKDPNLTEKLAAFVLTMRIEDENGQLVPLVTRDEAKLMTAAQVLSLVDWDHYPVRVETAKTLGMLPEEYNHPTNLQPLPIRTHRIKTAKIDNPAIAKSDRIRAEQEEFRRVLLRKLGTDEEVASPPRKKAGRSFQTNRNSLWRKPISGPPVRRTAKAEDR